MRVSTSQIYNLANISMTNAQSAVNRTNEQISTGKRVLSPADDPVAATKILRLNQELARADQFDKNISAAEHALNQEEVALDGIVNLLQRMKELSVQAGNTGVLTRNDYQALAAEVDSRLEELLNLQNTRNSSGQYIFAGHQGSTRPFVADGGGNYSYHGDEGQLRLQASENVTVPVSDSGKRLFVDIKSSHNTFDTFPSSSNRANPPAGISVGQVIDQEAFDQFYPRDLKITFNADEALDPPQANFTITERASGKVLMANEPYSHGDTIELHGMQFDITGQPMPGVAAQPATIDFGVVGTVDFTAAPATVRVRVGGVTETLVLDRNVTNATELAAALNSSVETVPGSGAAANSAKLANLGVSVSELGFSSDRGLDISVTSGTADTDTAFGFATQNEGTTATNGQRAQPGDVFHVQTTDKQGLLTTLSRLSHAMRNVEDNPESKNALSEVVAKTLSNLDNALTNVISVQGEVGARLNTLESSRELNADAKLHNEKVLADIQDLDYAEASTRLAMESFVLSAAQQSFMKVSSMSLFNYM
ncbi:flagellar hook-associated protein FlgL [Marinimicrobium sp. ABcell2]|uniref:flagellar hook-associated protein FlgL n=1 Tax=Marinimicrobium sp. ABcell2 TaxID=3069751 RepID=UPI0027B35F14|nr:flagellar hook-associated protein FlgL [Marinimicrobium sp. ABcell2]MDQ2077344.1 flagellar hook-associated protein FlgL [Marinimicrobium sp. ABcell2]